MIEINDAIITELLQCGRDTANVHANLSYTAVIYATAVGSANISPNDPVDYYSLGYQFGSSRIIRLFKLALGHLYRINRRRNFVAYHEYKRRLWLGWVQLPIIWGKLIIVFSIVHNFISCSISSMMSLMMATIENGDISAGSQINMTFTRTCRNYHGFNAILRLWWRASRIAFLADPVKRCY